jgi:hypothetical protein
MNPIGPDCFNRFTWRSDRPVRQDRELALQLAMDGCAARFDSAALASLSGVPLCEATGTRDFTSSPAQAALCVTALRPVTQPDRSSADPTFGWIFLTLNPP